MKSEKEIRSFRDDLRAHSRTPCTCTDPLRALVCAARLQEEACMALMLSWVLDEYPEMDASAEAVAAAVRR